MGLGRVAEESYEEFPTDQGRMPRQARPGQRPIPDRIMRSSLLIATPLLPTVSILLVLFTLFWCAILMPRLRYAPDRFLVGLIGLLSIQHGVQLLQAIGADTRVNDYGASQVTALVISALYLLAAFTLEFYTAEHRSFRVRLRLAEFGELAAHPAAREVDLPALRESSHLAIFALDADGRLRYCNEAAGRMLEVQGGELRLRASTPPDAAPQNLPGLGRKQETLAKPV